MIADNGGPAFPVHGGGDYGFDPRSQILGGGITVRDYFAAKAMQGMLANGITLDIDGERLAEKRAGVAYAIADAMLAERAK